MSVRRIKEGRGGCVVIAVQKEVARLIPPLVGTETIKPVAFSGLRHGFTLSTTTYDYSFARLESVCGLWQEDHLKINDGKEKETASWCHWRKPHRHSSWGYRLAGK